MLRRLRAGCLLLFYFLYGPLEHNQPFLPYSVTDGFDGWHQWFDFCSFCFNSHSRDFSLQRFYASPIQPIAYPFHCVLPPISTAALVFSS
jgi:hypothetical protein